MKLKLCFDAGTIEKGGMYTETINKLKYLIEDFDVFVIYKRKELDLPYDVPSYKLNPWRLRTSIRVLRNADLILTHSTTFILPAVLSGVPVVNVHRGFLPIRFRPRIRAKATGTLFKMFYLITSSFADYHIVPSKFMLQWLKDEFYIRDAACIPLGVDTTLFKPEKSNVEKFGDPALLYVGWISKGKGVVDLLHALPHVKDTFPHIGLTLIGYGDLVNQLPIFVKNLELEKHVRFLGYIPYQDLPAYYNSCDIFVMPSFWEASPLTIKEAMACGKPIVARNCTSLAEHVVESQSGNLFNTKEDLTDAISRCYIEEYEQKCKNALDYARRHDWKLIMEKYKQFLFEALVRRVRAFNSSSFP